ncbi:MAG TPA: 30S ribosomal protein S4 [Chthonomonas sp.]|uniref:30S ribosomal protein S4 n=1 Tax=Chthonomonas sp. TaxID=2282153 RepID=UPI002B4B6435|nr:30S ribosomal protein S4 [Chthonomonas sp.]HLI49682.1 30S ribosomal protein S4 [Chthonomonas sp.]
MANNHDPRCRQCRREGVKLFLKGDKCYTKCTLEKTSKDGKTKWRDKPPGWGSAISQIAAPQRKITEYGMQLREKQKLKRIYRVLEKPFRHYLDEAMRRPGVSGDNLVTLLETRLDNVVYRLGLASSRAQARQMVSHRFFTVNGERVNIPSYQVKPGDVIGIHESKAQKACIKEVRERMHTRPNLPEWLELNPQTLEGRVLAIPTHDQIDTHNVVQVQQIIEFYSR